MSDEPVQPAEESIYEEPEQPRPRRVRVPTTRCVSGEFADYVDCEPEAAAGWDARRWTRLA